MPQRTSLIKRLNDLRLKSHGLGLIRHDITHGLGLIRLTRSRTAIYPIEIGGNLGRLYTKTKDFKKKWDQSMRKRIPLQS